MNSYKFSNKDKEYVLSEENLEYFQNDEEAPVLDIDADAIISILNNKGNVEFTTEYYDLPCGTCNYGKESRKKYFDFLEYHFYIFTKDSKYVKSSISIDYQENTLDSLIKSGIVDDSYLVSITVCKNCGSYSVTVQK